MDRHLTEQDVRRMAAYTRIGLTDDEVPRMTADLNAIIEGLKLITEYDLDGVEPTFHPIGGLSNVMRGDVETACLSRDDVLVNAPEQSAGSFVVPSILGGRDA